MTFEINDDEKKDERKNHHLFLTQSECVRMNLCACERAVDRNHPFFIVLNAIVDFGVLL